LSLRLSDTTVDEPQIRPDEQAEIQYVALRNIQLICQKRSDILQAEVKVPFCLSLSSLLLSSLRVE